MKRYQSLIALIPLLILFCAAAVLAQQPCACLPASGTNTTPLPASMFGIDVLSVSAGNQPSVTVHGFRIWDSGCTWADINTSAGVYADTCLLHGLQNAKTAGVSRVLYTFGVTPAFISSNAAAGCSNHAGGCFPPSDLNSGDTTWKAFVTHLVNYSLASPNAKIGYYDCWNEPNASNYWHNLAGQTGNNAAGDLATLCNDAYTIIHSLDPSAVMVGPSPTSATSPSGFIAAYYTAGGNNDITTWHGDSNLASTITEIPNIRTAMANASKSGQQLWCTECDWGPTQNSSFTDDQKVAFLAQEYLQFYSLNIPSLYWYAWDGSNSQIWNTGTGIIPAGTAYSTLQSWIINSTYPTGSTLCISVSTTFTCGPYSYNGTTPAEILWDTASTPTVSVPVGYTTQFNLDGTSSAIVSNQVTLGIKPILVK